MQNHSVSHWHEVSRSLTLAGLAWAAVIGASAAQAQTYTVLYSFLGGTVDGRNPEAGLFLDAGNLYGTTVEGPSCSPIPCTPFSGIAFELSAAGKETIVHRFKGTPDGASPYGGFTAFPYGTTSAGGASNMGVVFKLAASGVTVLHNFTGSPGDGAFPYAGLVQDPAGNLYGTTIQGGASNNGTVFKLDVSGTETVLYSFTGGADGGFPYGGLILTSAGVLYGTTSAGGTTTGNCFPSGCGVMFEVNTAGEETVMHRFAGSPTDGAYPYSGLIEDTIGNLYGATFNGGAGACTNGCGVVFKMNLASRTETVLYSFAGFPADGAFPYAGLTRDPHGNLYGTATAGGTSDNGVVFELNTAGETVLHNFTGGTDGGVPRAPLILDSAGNLYGTTYSGGVIGSACGGSPIDTCGVVFKLVP